MSFRLISFCPAADATALAFKTDQTLSARKAKTFHISHLPEIRHVIEGSLKVSEILIHYL